jgi:hypothetical protein
VKAVLLRVYRNLSRLFLRFFIKEYLRTLNKHDTTRLLNIAEQRGFPSMLGSMITCIGSERIVL